MTMPGTTTPRLTVLADDLSGAAEAAAAFLDRDTPLALQLKTSRPGGGVTVVDLNTRAMTSQQAAQAVRASLADIPADVRVVKKIDSLLRGHVAAEVAVLAERGPVIVAPALPVLGRAVRGGVLYVGEKPLHETDAWAAEPGLPPRTVSELFADVPGELEIRDAASDPELDAIVAAAAPGAQLVGTSALAAAVARTLPPRRRRPPESEPSTTVLTVVGTAAPSASAQVSALIADGARHVAVDARALLHDKADPDPIQRALDHHSTVVTIAGVVEAAERQEVSAALGRLVAAADARRPDLVLTGGETARAVVDAIGLTTLHPVHEIHHGAVASVASDGRRVVTRPGSFGDPDSLVAIVRYLTQRSKDNS